MGARILVVEDNEANLQLVHYLLSCAGHQVLLARDGVEGVDIAYIERPDLVICDLQMPRLDGYGVLRALRSDPVTQSVPVIAVTAFSMPDDRMRVASAGFNGYLTKPIEPETFVAQIEAFLPGDMPRAH
jgi:CheY-like chemotaxis protein